MVGLNLDEWERDDIYMAFGVEKSNSNRSSVLNLEGTIDESKNVDHSENFIILAPGSQNDPVTPERNSSDKSFEAEVLVRSNLKRKELSPYGETQVARALKLHKGNSPVLRERIITTPRQRLGASLTPTTKAEKSSNG